MAYGARVRKVQMTRGNRQGNNAFLQYEDNHTRNPVHYITDEDFLARMLACEDVDPEMYRQVFKLQPNIEAHL